MLRLDVCDMTGNKDKILVLQKVAHRCQALFTIQLTNIVATTIISLVFDNEVYSSKMPWKNETFMNSDQY